LKADTIIMRRVPASPHEWAAGMRSRLSEAPHPYALIPQDQAGSELLAKIPLGEDVAVKLMRDRSLPQHRLFWSVLRYVAERSKWETAERLLVALKLRLGRYDLMQMPSGKVVPVPHSIAFSAMPQDDFQSFMDAAMGLICTEVLPGYSPDDLIREAESQP
jgi:hypothetical protein